MSTGGTGTGRRVGADPLWTSAFRAMLTQPATALAVLLAVDVAATIAASAPLFVASVGNEVFRRQLATAEGCPRPARRPGRRRSSARIGLATSHN